MLILLGVAVVVVGFAARFNPLLEELSDAAPGAFTLIVGDALTADEARLVDGRPTHVVANLPYNVGTPLLIKWLTGPWTPASMTLMFQKEVAERITSPTNGDAYGRLAVIAQATSDAKMVMEVPARAFTPPPKVDSAVVRLTPRADRPSPARLDALQKITAAAFGQRRKMLRGSLASLFPDPVAKLEGLGLSPTARAEELAVADFVRLAGLLTNE